MIKPMSLVRAIIPALNFCLDFFKMDDYNTIHKHHHNVCNDEDMIHGNCLTEKEITAGSFLCATHVLPPLSIDVEQREINES